MQKKIVSISNELSVWFDLKVGEVVETSVVGTDFYFQVIREKQNRIRITLQAGEKSKKALGIK